MVFRIERPPKQPLRYELAAGQVNGSYYLQTLWARNGSVIGSRATYYSRREDLENDLTRVVRARMRKGYAVLYSPRGHY